MNWTDIIVALISLAGAFLGTMYGIHKANNLTVYRIEQLEKKMDVHNGVQERVLLIEQQVKEIRGVIERISESVARQSEQVDSAFTLAEKNEEKIALIEKSILNRGGN